MQKKQTRNGQVQNYPTVLAVTNKLPIYNKETGEPSRRIAAVHQTNNSCF